MNKAEPLEPHGTPKALYERVRAGLEGETQRTGLPLHVGGGGVLEPRWDHRGSLDSDVVIQRDNPDAARRALDRAAEQSDGYRVQEPGFDRSELPDLPREEDVDVRPPFAGMVKNPAAAGRKAIADATYQRVRIRCEEEKAGHQLHRGSAAIRPGTGAAGSRAQRPPRARGDTPPSMQMDTAQTGPAPHWRGCAFSCRGGSRPGRFLTYGTARSRT